MMWLVSIISSTRGKMVGRGCTPGAGCLCLRIQQARHLYYFMYAVSSCKLIFCLIALHYSHHDRCTWLDLKFSTILYTGNQCALQTCRYESCDRVASSTGVRFAERVGSRRHHSAVQAVLHAFKMKTTWAKRKCVIQCFNSSLPKHHECRPVM